MSGRAETRRESQGHICAPGRFRGYEVEPHFTLVCDVCALCAVALSWRGGPNFTRQINYLFTRNMPCSTRARSCCRVAVHGNTSSQAQHAHERMPLQYAIGSWVPPGVGKGTRRASGSCQRQVLASCIPPCVRTASAVIVGRTEAACCWRAATVGRIATFGPPSQRISGASRRCANR